MIEKIIYLGLIIVFGYLYFKIWKYLRGNYFNSNKRNLNYGGVALIIPIILPKIHFKKRTFWKDYFLYVSQFICLFGAVYFFFKLIWILLV